MKINKCLPSLSLSTFLLHIVKKKLKKMDSMYILINILDYMLFLKEISREQILKEKKVISGHEQACK